MSRKGGNGFIRRIGGRKRSRVRVRLIVYVVFIAVTLAAALFGLAINRQIEQVWDAHWGWEGGR